VTGLEVVVGAVPVDAAGERRAHSGKVSVVRPDARPMRHRAGVATHPAAVAAHGRPWASPSSPTTAWGHRRVRTPRTYPVGPAPGCGFALEVITAGGGLLAAV
jgi:hypothetical protein